METELSEAFDEIEEAAYEEGQSAALNALVDDLAVALDLIASSADGSPEREDEAEVQAALDRLSAIVDARLDRASSASRQHWIDTGRYLKVGEVEA